MNQTNDLIARFVNATKEGREYKGETTAHGTIVVYGDSAYVQLDGSDLLTPIVSTTDVNDGDRVIVSLKNHTATVTGNISDPAVGRKRADGMESSITQTAEQIRLEVKNEVSELESSITLTADQIRSEVKDEVAQLESSITQTADQIRLEVSGVKSGLESDIKDVESSITQTADQIRLEVSGVKSGLESDIKDVESSITQTAEQIRLEVSGVKSDLESDIKDVESSITQTADTITLRITEVEDELDGTNTEFSEFKQTVEGFSFMNKGGSVKISSGDINLTGAITFSELSDDVEKEITDAGDTANTALTNANDASDLAFEAYRYAGDALTKASSAEEVAIEARVIASGLDLPDYLKSTYIDSTVIMSPVIVGGAFYAVSQTAWTEMDSEGLKIYTDGISVPKAEIVNDNETVSLILGAGYDVTVPNIGRFFLIKNIAGAEMTYFSKTTGLPCGITFNDSGNVTITGNLVVSKINGVPVT